MWMRWYDDGVHQLLPTQQLEDLSEFHLWKGLHFYWIYFYNLTVYAMNDEASIKKE